MRRCSHIGAAVVVCLLFTSAGQAQEQAGTAPTNDAILQHMQEMEREMKELRAQVAALQSGNSTSTSVAPVTPAPAPAAPQAAVATTTAAGSTPAPTGLAGLLGPTTLSGFVDTYYGFNFNHPPTRQNGLRNFDINTNQFGLNMIELVADKSVDTTNRVGYHIAVW